MAFLVICVIYMGAALVVRAAGWAVVRGVLMRIKAGLSAGVAMRSVVGGVCAVHVAHADDTSSGASNVPILRASRIAAAAIPFSRRV